MEEQKELLSLDIVLSESKVSLEEQSCRISSLDTKLGVLLGLSGVILAALLTSPPMDSNDKVISVMLICAIAFIIAALLSATWGYWIRKYKVPPDPTALRDSYLTEEPDKTKLALVDYISSAYYWNQQRIVGKVRFTHASFVLVLIGALIIGATILYHLV